MAPRSAAHAAHRVAAGRLRKDEGPVRSRAQDPEFAREVARIVCATDAGREGELIFRYIYEAAACAKPFSRLWISSLTPDAIRKGFDTCAPAATTTRSPTPPAAAAAPTGWSA